MTDEVCICQRCGYQFKMPRMEEIPDLASCLDVASWAYCMPGCLSADCGIRGDLSIQERLYRPIFRMRERRRFRKVSKWMCGRCAKKRFDAEQARR